MDPFQKVAEALEFDKMVQYIAEKCVSETGKQRLQNSYPLFDKNDLKRQLDLVGEMRQVFLVEGGFPLWEFYDIRILLNQIEPSQSYLDAHEFLKVQNFLEIIEEVRKFAKKFNEKYPLLNSMILKLNSLTRLLNQIQFSIEPSGRIFDNASNDLKGLRKALAKVNDEIHQRMNRIVRKNAEYIQEDFLTLSDGRLVVPVREFSVSKVPGIVHGQSGSGATYYVEPMAVVELNNQMQKLLAEERKEERRILRRLSDQVRELQNELTQNLHILNDLDVLQAKARYANEFKGQAPEINDDFSWDLRQARHPLLLKLHPQGTVPLNLQVGKQFTQLIISGPNAGGKTVALKTVGLLQLLFQSGFHIPLAEGSRMPLCKQIFTSIGDEQSIENDLSTFSSHIRSLKEIIEEAKEESLILIDEIGSGTEPSGGAALAIALLDTLRRPGIVTIVSTHLNQLKIYGAETEGVQNGAMQFDTETLNPLFTLEIGIPGSSYTFEICRRLGLDESLITRAIEISGKESFKLDQLLGEVAQKSQHYQELINQVSIKESKAGSLSALYEQKVLELTRKRKSYEKEAKEQAQALLKDVNRQIEQLVREIRESQADKQVIKKSKQRINELKSSVQLSDTPKRKAVLAIEDIQPGQRIRSLSYGINGQVSRIFTNKKQVEMEREGLKITIDLDDVLILDEHGQPLKQETKNDFPAKAVSGINIANELDLRGLMVEEAIGELERYLDLARMSSWKEVRIIHGKGTGALRQAVHQYLRNQKAIRFHLGKWGEGDTGVTVIELESE